ncbi:MAG: hypothetical protein GF335_02775 [Candidatus Moranbacteria bacterium]|nr:hypothetical protein [Candidatus Moranbacteria bacterium]
MNFEKAKEFILMGWNPSGVFTKRRLSKFNGIASHNFLIYLKECEFRWNYREELFEKMKKIIKKF